MLICWKQKTNKILLGFMSAVSVPRIQSPAQIWGFIHLADKSREGEGISNGTRLGAPKDREAISPRRLREPQGSEHDTSGVCNKCFLNELISPSAPLGNLAQNSEELLILNFVVSGNGKPGAL